MKKPIVKRRYSDRILKEIEEARRAKSELEKEEKERIRQENKEKLDQQLKEKELLLMESRMEFQRQKALMQERLANVAKRKIEQVPFVNKSVKKVHRPISVKQPVVRPDVPVKQEPVTFVRKKKAMYTVYLGEYDNVPVPHKFRSWHHILISDRPVNEKGWTKVIYVEPTDRPDFESRRYKWLSHKFLPDYDMVCYYDANMHIKIEPPSEPFRVKHRKRTSVKQEVEACNIQLHRCTPESLNEEYDYFISQGFEDNVGLFLNGFFCRMHDASENDLCEQVFEILERFTPRDQVALPFVIWKTGYKAIVKDAEFYLKIVRIKDHRIRKPRLHGEVTPVIEKKKPMEKVNVHHITPGRSDKNFGKAINTMIEGLPDEDWICLRDIDTLPMYHEMFFKQCEEIAGMNEFDLVGCMTNRLGLKYQLYNGQMSNEHDIMVHREIAKKLYEEHGSEVKSLNTTIGGLFMLFSKSTWKKVGGFPEGGISVNNSFIDHHFGQAVLKAKLKIGVAKGIYLFHFYRMEHGDNTRSKQAKQHLLK